MVVAALGPSLRNLIVVLALTSWVRFARISDAVLREVAPQHHVLM